MAITFNERTIAAQTVGIGVTRQPLLTEARVPNSRIRLDLWALAARAVAPAEIDARSVGWFQVLEGTLTLSEAGSDTSHALGDSHVVFLPPGFRGTLSSQTGARLLYAQVPEAAAIDPNLTSAPPPLRVVDWRREPVLDSEHDARKRIYLVTPKLFGTTAVKGEMIIYPPGTMAANHHHEGAEHFMYMLSGRGIAHANEEPFPVQAGDVVWFADHERHFFISEGDQDMVFVEFFAPGQYKTVWAPGASVCTWIATGRDIGGNVPAREIRSHSSANKEAQVDV
jgi:quercetin dioxygenase-like cupin family protein